MEARDALRSFWLIFAGLGVAAMLGLLLYNRMFALDTELTRHRARLVMIGIYAILLAPGSLFLYSSVFGVESIAYKTMIQAIIMLLIGAGGTTMSFGRNGQQSRGNP